MMAETPEHLSEMGNEDRQQEQQDKPAAGDLSPKQTAASDHEQRVSSRRPRGGDEEEPVSKQGSEKRNPDVLGVSGKFWQQ